MSSKLLEKMGEVDNTLSLLTQAQEARVQFLKEFYKDVTITKEVITAAIAAEYLTRNKRNRGLRPDTVDVYSREMLNDAFLLSNDCVCFDVLGWLMNSQHRLNAIVKTGLPHILCVARNMPPECQMVMDQPLVRRVHDLLRLAGVEDADTNLGSLINSMKYPSSKRAKDRLTSQEAFAFVGRYEPAILFATQHAKNGRKKGTGRASLRAVVARAWYHVDHERLAQFCEIIQSSDFEMVAGNEAAYRIRQYLMTAATGEDRLTIHFKCERALLAFVERKPLDKLYAAAEELFPLPGEHK